MDDPLHQQTTPKRPPGIALEAPAAHATSTMALPTSPLLPHQSGEPTPLHHS